MREARTPTNMIATKDRECHSMEPSETEVSGGTTWRNLEFHKTSKVRDFTCFGTINFTQ